MREATAVARMCRVLGAYRLHRNFLIRLAKSRTVTVSLWSCGWLGVQIHRPPCTASIRHCFETHRLSYYRNVSCLRQRDHAPSTVRQKIITTVLCCIIDVHNDVTHSWAVYLHLSVGLGVWFLNFVSAISICQRFVRVKLCFLDVTGYSFSWVWVTMHAVDHLERLVSEMTSCVSR